MELPGTLQDEHENIDHETLNENVAHVADVTWPERRIFFFALSFAPFALFALASKTQLQRLNGGDGGKLSHLDRGQCAAFALSLRRLLILDLHFACGKMKEAQLNS